MTQPPVREIELQELEATTTERPLVMQELPFVPSLKVKATLTLGFVEITIGKLQSLKRDEILELDRKLDELVDLTVDGHVVARGTLVAVGDHFGFRVLETPRG